MNISNMNKEEVDHVLEKIYPIFQIPQIDNLDIVLNTKMNSKHDKVIDEFKEIYKERDEIIGYLEKNKNKNVSIYGEITKGFINLNIENLFKIFTGNEEYHYIGMDFFNEKSNSQLKIDNQLYYNIRITTIRTKDKYLPYYFEGEKYVDFYYKRLLDNLPKIYINLETHGNLMIMYLFPSYKMIKIYYLLTIMFEEVYLLFRHIIVCKKFKNDIKHLKYITEIIQNEYKFSFTKDVPMDSIFDYLKYHIQYDLYFKYQLIIKKNKKMYRIHAPTISYLTKDMHIELPNIKEKEKTFLNLKIDKKSFLKNSYLSQLFLKKKTKVLSLGFSNDVYQYKKLLDPSIELCFLLNDLNESKNISDIEIIKINKDDIFDSFIQLLNKKRMFDYIFINMILDYNDMLYYSMFIKKILINNGYFIIKNAHFNEINQCVIHIENTMKDFKKIMNLGNIVIFQYLVR